MKSALDATPLLNAAQPTPPDMQRSTRDKESLKKSCQGFEAIFIQSLFKAMQKTVPDGGLIKKGSATEMFEEMLHQEIANKISQKQSLGLADQMYRQMEKKVDPAK
ncbi:MAG: rod-binding protein [Desulfobulbaceae bacterium]|nr:rod-binding protein [Desulfobulbaceae bacterium]